MTLKKKTDLNATQGLWTEELIRETFRYSADVQVLSVQLTADRESTLILAYADGLSDDRLLGEIVLPQLRLVWETEGPDGFCGKRVHGTLPLLPIDGGESADALAEWLFQGDVLLLLPEAAISSGEPPFLFRMSISQRPVRMPDESNTEISIKGPRDGFVEDLITNVSLVRKRLRSPSLHYEAFTLGRRTKSKAALLYMGDIAPSAVIEEARNRLRNIDMDGIFSIGQLEEQLADSKYSLLPTLDTTGRPDYIVQSLLAGRFAVILDGNPMVLIGPAGLSMLLKSPEDAYFNFYYISFARAIRFFSFFLSILLPGIWVSLSAFHQDQIPFRLMATIVTARLGLPFSAQMELFLLLVLLEIFREAGLRLPSAIGQTLTVIGGLIIGDASIRAGLVSPSVVVVGAITAVSGATLVNQSLSAAVSVLRFCLFLLSAVLGMYGLLLGIILMVAYMSRLGSYGVPFLTPISPPVFRDMIQSFLRVPWDKMKKRPAFLRTSDTTKEGEEGS
ncbi:spore germination protein [Paenibacillus sp. HJGM_3]|uniref:spore germination protein n=1 Tax=Paenibacillus sp. HJGM_3 TaxID=3379816 RepID=UPI00385FED36